MGDGLHRWQGGLQGSDVIPIAWIDVHIEEHRFIEAARGGLSPLEMRVMRLDSIALVRS